MLLFVDLQGADLQSDEPWFEALTGFTFGRPDTNLLGTIFWDANLQGANLHGANLKGIRHLTKEQLDMANGDDRTALPPGLTRPVHWSKAERPEGAPTAQLDAGERASAEEGGPEPEK